MKCNVIAAVVAVVTVALPGAAAAEEDARDPQAVLVDMFTWWNAAFHESDGFTAQAFRRHFTEDARMIINGSLRAEGVESLAKHFTRIRERVDDVEIVLPFKEAFSAGNKTFTYHKVRARNDGEETIERVMGWAEIRGGKLAVINFLSVEDAPKSAQ